MWIFEENYIRSLVEEEEDEFALCFSHRLITLDRGGEREKKKKKTLCRMMFCQWLFNMARLKSAAYKSVQGIFLFSPPYPLSRNFHWMGSFSHFHFMPEILPTKISWATSLKRQ